MKQSGNGYKLSKFVQKIFADFIVHCDAGISRSSGVAAAILKAKTGDDSQIFNNPKYRPNMRCYRIVLDEFMQED